jgi:hypothetical protein
MAALHRKAALWPRHGEHQLTEGVRSVEGRPVYDVGTSGPLLEM